MGRSAAQFGEALDTLFRFGVEFDAGAGSGGHRVFQGITFDYFSTTIQLVPHGVDHFVDPFKPKDGLRATRPTFLGPRVWE